MPFKSEKQRRWMWANDPEMARRWEDEENESVQKEGRKMKITRRQIKRIIKEELNEADNYPRITFPGSGVQRPAGAAGPLENLAEDILSLIDNLTDKVDLDFGPDPMTRKDIIDFVMRILVEQEPSATVPGKVSATFARKKYEPMEGDKTIYSKQAGLDPWEK